MSSTYFNGSETRFVVTPEGHEAAIATERCDCEYRINVSLLVCVKCGTGVGIGRQSDYATANRGKTSRS